MTAAAVIVEAQRLRLIRVAQAAGLPAREVLRLARGELDALADATDLECRAYARALLSGEVRRSGRVPFAWTQACRCGGCGVVWLWPEAPAEVKACPWCWNRLEGLPVPSAGAAL